MESISDAVIFRKRKFDVDEYRRLGETGMLNEDDHVELIEGDLLELEPISGEHATVVSISAMIVARQGSASQILPVQDSLRPDRSSGLNRISS